jgi:voltage-gated potassium channel
MLQKRLMGILLALIIVLFTGVSGYQLIEGWSVLDALYMTVITLASVGFMEVHTLSDVGRMFTMFLILGGTGVLVYGISTVTAFIVGGELTDALRRKAMQKKIDALKGHYIVCGADQTGRYAVEELIKTKKDFLVIEKAPDKIKELTDKGIFCIEGDATHNAVLQEAGIERAGGLIATLHSDAENLFVVFTAKRLNAAIRVVSKALEEESEQKIRMAGADGVVMPNYIGGLRMVSEMIRPAVVTFLDIMLRERDKTIRIEDIRIPAGSLLAGKTLAESGIPALEGATIVALKDEEGNYLFNPQKNTSLTENSTLVLMGKVETIDNIRSMFKLPA